ncbi:MAG: prepilin-type N-terminal cleavage/methylation domain-containing protein [Deltaproteobacteria bacterium]|nr:prepilin-type N-terminal cleavage/methylation domain-containing protein [Deltaproteobacteria bacterium]
MKSATKYSKGFTLIELMVALALTSIIMAGIMAAYISQLKSHVTQQTIVEMQQNLRSAMQHMEKEIRMAGYDDPNKTSVASITTVLANTFEFTMDLNDDGDVSDPNETVLYTLAANTSGTQCLMRNTGGGNQPIAENIEALNFVYLDRFRVPTNVAIDVRSVQITIVAKSSRVNPVLFNRQIDNQVYRNQQGAIVLPAMNDTFRRMAVMTDIKCRNL